MTGETESLPRTLEGITRLCEHRLSAKGVCVDARVLESDRAFDLAVGLTQDAPAVVRCVHQATVEDHHALATMLAQGDFHRAALVYTAEDQPHLSGEIETYPLSRIDELAASLAKERTP